MRVSLAVLHVFSDAGVKPHMPQTKSARTTHRAEAADSINPVAGGAPKVGGGATEYGYEVRLLRADRGLPSLTSLRSLVAIANGDALLARPSPPYAAFAHAAAAFISSRAYTVYCAQAGHIGGPGRPATAFSAGAARRGCSPPSLCPSAHRAHTHEVRTHRRGLVPAVADLPRELQSSKVFPSSRRPQRRRGFRSHPPPRRAAPPHIAEAVAVVVAAVAAATRLPARR